MVTYVTHKSIDWLNMFVDCSFYSCSFIYLTGSVDETMTKYCRSRGHVPRVCIAELHCSADPATAKDSERSRGSGKRNRGRVDLGSIASFFWIAPLELCGTWYTRGREKKLNVCDNAPAMPHRGPGQLLKKAPWQRRGRTSECLGFAKILKEDQWPPHSASRPLAGRLSQIFFCLYSTRNRMKHCEERRIASQPMILVDKRIPL